MSTRALTDANVDPALVAVTDTYTYDAFGVLVASTGTTANAYRYTGEQYDANVGFYYLRARYYNQGVGRFVSADPFLGCNVDPVSLHRYLYANADPVNKRDPSGNTTLADVNIALAIRGILMQIQLRVTVRAGLTALKYGLIASCKQWADREAAYAASTGWLNLLPSCPCTLNQAISEGGWRLESENLIWLASKSSYHIGAEECVRSASIQGHGQQCCYDTDDDLITHGWAAGTPDRTHVDDLSGHEADDVNPWHWCVLARFEISQYHRARPPNNNRSCTVNRVPTWLPY